MLSGGCFGETVIVALRLSIAALVRARVAQLRRKSSLEYITWQEPLGLDANMPHSTLKISIPRLQRQVATPATSEDTVSKLPVLDLNNHRMNASICGVSLAGM